MFYTFMTNQQMHFYQYVQSHIVFQQHVSPTAVTIISVSYIENQVQLQAVFIIHFCTVICTLYTVMEISLVTDMCFWRLTNVTEHVYVQVHLLVYRTSTGWHKETGTFENSNINWRNPRKNIYLQKLNHYNLPFKRQYSKLSVFENYVL